MGRKAKKPVSPWALVALAAGLLALPGLAFALSIAPPRAPYIPLTLSVILPIRVKQILLSLGPCAVALACARRAITQERRGLVHYRGTQLSILAITLSVLVFGLSLWKIPRTESPTLAPTNVAVEDAAAAAHAALAAVLNYARSHGGPFPDTLNEVPAKGFTPADYTYTGRGLNWNSVGDAQTPLRVIVLYERQERGNAGRVVAYNLPPIKWVDRADWEATLAADAAARRTLNRN